MVTNCINNSKCMRFVSIFTRVWAKKNCCQAGRRFAFFLWGLQWNITACAGNLPQTWFLDIPASHLRQSWLPGGYAHAPSTICTPVTIPAVHQRMEDPNKSEIRTQSDQSIVDFVGLLIEMTKKTANRQLDIFPTGAWPSQKETLHLKANTTETFTQTTSSGTLKLYSKLKIINLDFPKIREPHQLHAGWCQLVHPKIQLTSWIATMRHDQTCAWTSRPIYPFFSPNSILGSLKSERIQLIHCRSNESAWNIY